MKNNKIIQISIGIAGFALVTYAIYRIYKFQMLKISNQTKDNRNIKIITS